MTADSRSVKYMVFHNRRIMLYNLLTIIIYLISMNEEICYLKLPTKKKIKNIIIHKTVMLMNRD